MAEPLIDIDFKAALDACADEAIRTFPTIQPFGALFAARLEDGVIHHASANLHDVCGLNAEDVLGQSVADVFGQEMWHTMNNRAAQASYRARRLSVGEFENGDRRCVTNAFSRNGFHVVELEAASDTDEVDYDPQTVASLVQQINDAKTVQPLLETTVRLLRLFTGFDRVMVYKFDKEFNGEVIAEDRTSVVEPFLGLRFPHWDIPRQAREVMRELPLRLIMDIEEDGVPILSSRSEAASVDISLAHTRGVPKVHLQYLRNMNVLSTMTLSVVVDERLWGIISFHHRRVRRASHRQRAVLEEFLLFFNTKMAALLNAEALALAQRIENAKNAIYVEVEKDRDLDHAFGKISPILWESFKADGVASLTGSQSNQTGQVPGQAVLDRLITIARDRTDQVFAIDNLTRAFPDLADDMNGIAGALIAATGENRLFVIFRKPSILEIAWAGSPHKTVIGTGAMARLEPRGSFAAYKEVISGNCDPWTDEDLLLANRLWPIVNSVERRVLMNTINRQQKLMIQELNHRVRNILALVRAVSRQARRRYGSLNSYAEAIEARIQSLAAAHDIGDSSEKRAVPLSHIVRTESAPYQGPGNPRIYLEGGDHGIMPEIAPIFALIIHELMTNAAKYGALSNDHGTVTLTLSGAPDGLNIHWVEKGGPEVVTPETTGFGTILIERAVPHELGGRAKLTFHTTGVEAELFLPDGVLRAPSPRAAVEQRSAIHPTVEPRKLNVSGTVLLVEDNFIIAKEMSDQLHDMGFRQVELCGNIADALDMLEEVTPVLALLDVNLGNGKTSLPIAERLVARRIPFIFATGYGEKRDANPALDTVPTLTKPVSPYDLQSTIAEVLPGAVEPA